MIEDFFEYVYVVGVILIVCLFYIVTHMIFKKGNELESKLITQNVGSTDGFHRVRISNPHTLGDYKHVYGVNPDMLNHLVSGGTVTHNANESSVKLAVTDTIGSRAVHQSKMYHHYMPGKSQLIMSTFVFKGHNKGISKKTGYFDDRDGFYFEENENNELQFVLRSFTTGSAVNRIVKQSDWNGDRINGKGPSGWKIDTTKTQLAWFDMQWLGVGRVRCGFIHKDEFLLCHTFYNSNVLDKVHISNPMLPIRCEIENISSSDSCNFDQICSTVISEGGYSEAGRDYSVLSSLSTINVIQNQIQIINVIGIKLKNTFNNRPNRIFVRLLDVRVFSDSSNVKYEVLKVSSTHTTAAITSDDDTEPDNIVSVNADSGVQYINECNIVGTTEVIGSGIVAASTQGQKHIGSIGSTSVSDAKKNFISQNFTSTFSDAFVVRVIELQDTDTNVTVSMTWREIY